MSIETPISSRNKVSWFKIAGAFAAFLVALATFDPHLTNLELVSHALTNFLPILSTTLAVFIVYFSIQRGILKLLWHHKLLTLAGILLFGFVTIQFIESGAKSATGQRRDALKVYAEGMSAARNQTKSYISGFGQLLSRAAWVRNFRRDMAIRSAFSFRHFDFNLARSYLLAGQKSFDGYGGTEMIDGSLRYLEARERYVSNHDARIASLERQGQLSPLLSYLERSSYALDPTATRKVRVERHLIATAAALKGASDSIERCSKPDGAALKISLATVQILAQLADATGEFPTPGMDLQAWCKAIADLAKIQDGEGESIGGRFQSTVAAYWGSVDDRPSRVMWYADDSGSEADENDGF